MTPELDIVPRLIWCPTCEVRWHTRAGLRCWMCQALGRLWKPDPARGNEPVPGGRVG